MYKRAALFASRSFHRPYPCRTMTLLSATASKTNISFTAKSSIVRKQHIVVALGGNAILQRGEEMTAENQQKNIKACVSSMEGLLKNYKVTLVHGNGPQVGLLALMSAEHEKISAVKPMSLDILDAETEGMIGYLLEQEICWHIGPERGVATLLSEIVVDPKDPAFQNPTKFVGPAYTEEEAKKLSETKVLKKDGTYGWRQVVPSPLPVRLIDQNMRALRVLTDNDCIVICAGGGGIPVTEEIETDSIRGVEAVIDKDRSAAMLAKDLDADGLLILTDVKAVATGYGTQNPRWIKSASPDMLLKLMHEFPAGSMGPKVESAIEFVAQKERWGMIGSLNEVNEIMTHKAGTFVTTDYGKEHLVFY